MYYFPVNLFLVSLRGREHRGVCRGPARPPAHSISAGPRGAPAAGRMLGPGPPDGSRREFWQWKQEGVSATAPKYVFTAQSTGSAAFEQRRKPCKRIVSFQVLRVHSATCISVLCLQWPPCRHTLAITVACVLRFDLRNGWGPKPGSEEPWGLSSAPAHSVSSLLLPRSSSCLFMAWSSPSPSGCTEPWKYVYILSEPF